MASQEPQQIRVGPTPQENLAPLLRDPPHDPPRDRDLPDPPLHSTQSDPDLSFSSQQQTTEPTSSVPTNRTTLTSVPRDKSAPDSLYEPVVQSDAKPRRPSASVYEHDRNGIGRYQSVARPRPVLSLSGDHRAQSGLEWIIPTTGDRRREKTAGERLEPTLIVARVERDKYASKAKRYGLALNLAIGLQVGVGALTTGVAAASTNGRALSIGVSILGGISTMLASFLAKARGSNEPDFSNLRSRELSTFIREAEAWTMDHGHIIGPEQDKRINEFRQRFEEIIKTEGEDSGTGTGFSPQAHPPNTAPSQTQPLNPKASEKV